MSKSPNISEISRLESKNSIRLEEGNTNSFNKENRGNNERSISHSLGVILLGIVLTSAVGIMAFVFSPTCTGTGETQQIKDLCECSGFKISLPEFVNKDEKNTVKCIGKIENIEVIDEAIPATNYDMDETYLRNLPFLSDDNPTEASEQASLRSNPIMFSRYYNSINNYTVSYSKAVPTNPDPMDSKWSSLTFSTEQALKLVDGEYILASYDISDYVIAECMSHPTELQNKNIYFVLWNECELTFDQLDEDNSEFVVNRRNFGDIYRSEVVPIGESELPIAYNYISSFLDDNDSCTPEIPLVGDYTCSFGELMTEKTYSHLLCISEDVEMCDQIVRTLKFETMITHGVIFTSEADIIAECDVEAEGILNSLLNNPAYKTQMESQLAKDTVYNQNYNRCVDEKTELNESYIPRDPSES